MNACPYGKWILLCGIDHLFRNGQNYFPFERYKDWPGEPIVIKESLTASKGKDIKIITAFSVGSTFKLYAYNLQAATTKVKNKTPSSSPQNLEFIWLKALKLAFCGVYTT